VGRQLENSPTIASEQQLSKDHQQNAIFNIAVLVSNDGHPPNSNDHNAIRNGSFTSTPAACRAQECADTADDA
jgi:hypothetical protein